MDVSDARLRNIWNQKRIPVVLRREGKGQRPRIRLPYSPTNKEWLQKNRKYSPEWIDEFRCWEIPKRWFNDFVRDALERFSNLYVIQPYREQEKCASACWNAEGHICECSCMGEHHGVGNDGSWFEVSDAFATRWGGLHLACRLMTRKPLYLRKP